MSVASIILGFLWSLSFSQSDSTPKSLDYYYSQDTLIYQWLYKSKFPVLKSKQKKLFPLSLIKNKEDKESIEYSGSKSISISTGDEIEIQQSLQLEAKGSITEDLFIRAYLSDKDIPIQSEGYTANLQEVDQIFIELYSSYYSLLFGDFILDFGKEKEDNLVARVKGLKFEYLSKEWSGKWYLTNSSGDFHSYNFRGDYGKQKDYFLVNKQGNYPITVLSGTEKIWRQGTLLVRDKDYQIDYGERACRFFVF